MPLTLVQGSSLGVWGAANNAADPTAAVAVTWAQARGVGNKLILCTGSDGTFTDPTNWTLASTIVGDAGVYIWERIATNGAEDSPSLDNNARTAIAWAEYSGNTADAFDVEQSQTDGTGVGAQSTGTTLTTAQADELAVAIHCSSRTGAAVTFGSHTNGFAEVAETGTTAAGLNIGISVSTLALVATQTVEVAATPSASAWRGACVATFKASAAGAIFNAHLVTTGGWVF